MSAGQFVSQLKSIEPGACCANPYRGYAPDLDASPGACEQRSRQLETYLDLRLESARLLMIAEAPGYQGARFSGIAMTCERTLLGGKAAVPAGAVLGTSLAGVRTSRPDAGRNAKERRSGFCEPTATIVWGELVKRQVCDRVVLWNAFPFHPHKAGQSLANRTPTEDEVSARLDVLQAFLDLFPEREVVAVGETSRRHIARLGVSAAAVRHPANGGATLFRNGITTMLGRIRAVEPRGPSRP